MKLSCSASFVNELQVMVDLFRFTLSCNTSNTSDSVSSGYPNTEKRVENTKRSGEFLTKFEGVWMADETLSRVFDISS